MVNDNNDEIAVTLLFFGAARDAVGQSEVNMPLKARQTAAVAFAEVLEKFPALRRFGRSLLFAVNHEYSSSDSNREICEGDELAVFPPVSGGATGKAGSAGAGSADILSASTSSGTETTETSPDFFELTTDPIDVGAVARRVVLPECGATVTLDGYAREWTSGRRTLYLVYEAYAPMALRELRATRT